MTKMEWAIGCNCVEFIYLLYKEALIVCIFCFIYMPGTLVLTINLSSFVRVTLCTIEYVEP